MIKVNQIFNNYGSLVDEIGLPRLQGNSKRAQIKELERYYRFERSGHKWLVKEIYPVPLCKIDKRMSGNNNLYAKDIQIVLLCELLQMKQEQQIQTDDDGSVTLYLTRQRLYKMLGMVNENYTRIDVEDLKALDNRIDQRQLNIFYSIADKKLSDILETSLRSLHRQKLINYKLRYMAISHNKHFPVSELLEDKILEIEKTALIEISPDRNKPYKTTYPLLLNGKLQNYYTIVNNMVKKIVSPNWDGIYKVIQVSCTPRYISQGIADNVEDRKQILNRNIHESIDRDLTNKIENYIPKWELAEEQNHPEYIPQGWCKELYVEIQRELSAWLISLDDKTLAAVQKI